jgi:hypothetical protein
MLAEPKQIALSWSADDLAITTLELPWPSLLVEEE